MILLILMVKVMNISTATIKQNNSKSNHYVEASNKKHFLNAASLAATLPSSHMTITNSHTPCIMLIRQAHSYPVFLYLSRLADRHSRIRE